MIKILKLLFANILLILICFSCKKDNEEPSLKVNLIISKLICYPYDSISMTFTVNTTGGMSPYSYKWISPDTFSGAGPFTIDIKKDILINLIVRDTSKKQVDFFYHLKKDTIDFLKYDYRNPFTGFYRCYVINQYPTYDSIGKLLIKSIAYYDTIEISKSDDFRELSISNLPRVGFNYKDSSFSGYHTGGFFHNDSIKFYFYVSPGGAESYSYKGVKIK